MSFFGTQNKLKQIPNLSPEQSQVLNQLLGLLGGQGIGGAGNALNYYSGILGGSPGASNAMELGARENFQSRTIPQILERFSGQGARSSSALNQTLAQAGRGLESDLAGQRAQMQSGAAQNLLSALQSLGSLGLGSKPFGYQQLEGSQGFLGKLAGPLGSALGTGLGNPAGGAITEILKHLFGL